MASTMTGTKTEHRCLRPGCNGKLTSPESIARGYSKACAAKIRAAAKAADLSAWTPSQLEDAHQAVEDGAVVPSTRSGVFQVVSSDGSEVYRTHADGCTCPNGLKPRPGRPCWHRAAVVIVLGVPAPAVPARAPLALPPAPVPVPADDVWAALEAVGALDLIPAF